MSENIIKWINPKELTPDPNQPRKYFDKDKIKELRKTIDEQGIIDPIEVDENNVIIRGERRWRAALLHPPLNMVPIRRKIGLTKTDRLIRQLTEDAQGVELNPMEKAWGYATAIINLNQDEHEYTIPELKKLDQVVLINLLQLGQKGGPKSKGKGSKGLSDKIGKNQKTIWNYVKCLYLEPETQALIGKGIPHTYADSIAKLYPAHLKVKADIEKMLRNGEIITKAELTQCINSLLENEDKLYPPEDEEDYTFEGWFTGSPKDVAYRYLNMRDQIKLLEIELESLHKHLIVAYVKQNNPTEEELKAFMQHKRIGIFRKGILFYEETIDIYNIECINLENGKWKYNQEKDIHKYGSYW